jgi:hypothetical protein
MSLEKTLKPFWVNAQERGGKITILFPSFSPNNNDKKTLSSWGGGEETDALGKITNNLLLSENFPVHFYS